MDSSADAEPKPNLNPLRIYDILKNAQQKHGLRHENYQRYRGYCSRRIERIRKSLKFTNQYKCLPKRPGKFIARIVTPELVGDIRYLEIIVFEMERNWAYAMQFKIEALDEQFSRKKFGMRQKLRKAVKWAKYLESLVEGNELVQDVTKLEAKAYSAFIHASLALELKDWKNAAAHFDLARTFYAELLDGVQGADMAGLYLNRCKELETLLKLCRSESGDAEVLLSTVSSLNLNASETEGIQKNAALEQQEEAKLSSLVNQQQSRKGKKKQKERKEPKPVKPFFFDLALNFVKPSSQSAASTN